MKRIEELIIQVVKNVEYGAYIPFNEKDSKILREYYISELPKKCKINGDTIWISNKIGTTISYGYERIVVGDYGSYLEIKPDSIVESNLEPLFSGSPKRKVKYIWLETKDKERTKVYLQKRKVAYADYKPGMYYVGVYDVVF